MQSRWMNTTTTVTLALAASSASIGDTITQGGANHGYAIRGEY